MDPLPSDRDPTKGDTFIHPTGAFEAVYCTIDGRVMTFCEYPSIDQFIAHVGDASYDGLDGEVASLPSPVEMARHGADAFEDGQLRDTGHDDDARDPAGATAVSWGGDGAHPGGGEVD